MARTEGTPRGIEFTPPTTTEIEEYDTHISAEDTRVMLERLGYGPSKMFVDEIYIHKDGKKAVGVLTVTEEHCEGHFGIFRGVDHVEAIGQTILLLQQYAGKLPEGHLPTLKITDTKANREGFSEDAGNELEEGVAANLTDNLIEAHNLAYPGSILNMFVEMNDSVENDFSGSGVVVSRGKVLSTVEGKGQMIKRELLPLIIKRESRLDARVAPLFPPRG